MRATRRLALLAMFLAIVAVGPTAAAASLYDGFESYPPGERWFDGTQHGPWVSAFDGYGVNSVASADSNVLSLAPASATSPSETHAGLVRTAASFGDGTLRARVRTITQLRRGSAPNPWEVGWVLWHFTDFTHFYYLALKPNGWELGKADPAYPGSQRFLASNDAPVYPVGTWHTVTLQQTGSTLRIWVDGAPLTTFTDSERPYLTGAVGLYAEDALVHFDDVSVSG